MGFYVDQVVPRTIDVVCGSRFFDPWRHRVCLGLAGDVLEIGFGSGANVQHYPLAVERVTAVELSGVARQRAASTISRARCPVTVRDTTRGSAPLGDQTFDAALCTFTLCSVDDPAAVLGEILRILTPGGSLHFLEHGLAPDRATARWQHRLNGFEQRFAGGCQLIREPLSLVGDAGFDVQWTEQNYAPGAETVEFLHSRGGRQASSLTAPIRAVPVAGKNRI
jgi:SAM-dependent methyltransferase